MRPRAPTCSCSATAAAAPCAAPCSGRWDCTARCTPPAPPPSSGPQPSPRLLRHRPEEHTMRHTTVADVMSTNVISAKPQDSFAQLAAMLRNAAIRAVPVVDDDGKLEGVVSEADLMTAVAHAEGGDARR